MADEPEVIRRHMEDTRTDLSDKLEILEEDFAGKVHDVTDSVTETVQNVKETVDDTISTVHDAVHETLGALKSTFDVAHQVDQHPWLMLGGAVAAGYIGGCVLANLEGPGTAGAGSSFLGSHDPTYQAGASAFSGSGHEKSATGHWLGEMAEKFQPEIAQLKGLAIGAALSILRDLVTRSLPAEARQQVTETVDGFTTKLGGKPMQGLLAEASHEQPEPYTARRIPSM